MKSLKPLFFLTGILMVLWVVPGCLGNYGKIRMATGDHNATIQDLKDNWETTLKRKNKWGSFMSFFHD